MNTQKMCRSLFVSFGALTLCHTTLAAQDAQTFNSSFAVPVCNSIDENGVDLVTGAWRVRTPTVTDGADGRSYGLEWTGSSWRHFDSPAIWRDGNTYIVQLDGKSYEFKNRSNGFAKKEPTDGSTLDCSIFQPQDWASKCVFVSHDGDVAFFQGVTPFTPTFPGYGFLTLRFGNLGMNQVNVSRASQGNPTIDSFSNTGKGILMDPPPQFTLGGGNQYGSVNIGQLNSDYDD